MARCPEFKCNQAITTTVFNSLLTDKDDRDKYNLYHIRNFIEVGNENNVCLLIAVIMLLFSWLLLDQQEYEILPSSKMR